MALQSLFQIDVGAADPEFAIFQALARLAEEPGPAFPEKDAAYMRKLVLGATTHREEIDREIGRLAREWALDRMANVDRNVLRLAIYEIMHEEGVPASAVINEAVELAKQYSTAESGKFVNGILGNLLRQARQGETHAETISRD